MLRNCSPRASACAARPWAQPLKIYRSVYVLYMYGGLYPHSLLTKDQGALRIARLANSDPADLGWPSTRGPYCCGGEGGRGGGNWGGELGGGIGEY